MSNDKREKKDKLIGDVTSFTIPDTYVDFVTGERKDVTKQQLKTINEALGRRGLVHLVMTGISLVDEHVLDDNKINVTNKVEQMSHQVKTIEYLVRGLYEFKIGH
ncbi:hypothetical protein [Paenibacillus macquariensis]|uniref:Uncharacterized protein n=1 Tax=Paenibacillus macquariensis TaxID=948756 RepID=A0ABY1KEM0_9BACL|nr:hypothetical protein [Paenibacillus macquariensis]OAB28400.1 hypothetical protein PMSM_24400 [Paenibacillus macquariensis subsp. macquariensis]SIR71518.1 hypothetical protein SAMN05421578_1421 [Paenibacillus macquariensis]